MKKQLRDRIWAKVIAVIIYTAGAVILAVCIAGALIIDSMSASPEWNSDSAISDDLRYYAGTHYAAFLLEKIAREGENTDLDVLRDTNMEYAVYRVNGAEYKDVDLTLKKGKNSELLYETEGFRDNIGLFTKAGGQVVGRVPSRHDAGVMEGGPGYYYSFDIWDLRMYEAYAYDSNEGKGDTAYYVLFLPKATLSTDINDLYMKAFRLSEFIALFRRVWGYFAVAAALMLIVSYCFLMWAAGKREYVRSTVPEGETEVRYVLNVTERVPLGVFLAVPVIVLLLSAMFGIDLIRFRNGLARDFVFAAVFVFAALLSLLLSANIAVRVKSGTLLHNTLLRRLFDVILGICGALRENIPLTLKTVFFLLAVFILQFLGLESTRYSHDWRMLLFFLYKIVETVFVMWAVLQMSRIRAATRTIAEGHLDEEIDTGHMYWEFKRYAGDLSRITDGIQTAVDERMESEHARLKSERMRSELITNVSHDIKTPLTSIINYVDLTDGLIRKEEIDRTKLEEYVDVLKRQSARLKKLTGDLIEASKAATGNIEVRPEDCRLDVMIDQVTGEYAERFAEKRLELVTSMPGGDIHVLADGRYLFRVFDNLFSNAYKYSLEGTRVYLDVDLSGESMARITLRNISKDRLGVSADELTERFVRGDSSRTGTTEGSGLGLSIADSLCRLMNGTMTVSSDGDLFKVLVELPMCQGV